MSDTETPQALDDAAAVYRALSAYYATRPVELDGTVVTLPATTVRMATYEGRRYAVITPAGGASVVYRVRDRQLRFMKKPPPEVL